MNPLDEVLWTMRIANSRYMRVEARAPWNISFRSRETTRLVMIAHGACHLESSALAESRTLASGDCFVVQAGTEFTLHDVEGEGASCPPVDCEEIFAAVDGTTVRHGGGGAVTDVLSGRFSFDALAAEPLLAMLPALFQLDLSSPAGAVLRSTFDLLAREEQLAGLGADLVTSRLTDVLFVQAVRTFCTTLLDGIGWVAALHDPQLAPALRAMHEDPARPWTVASLAREVGLSRSAFAVAFRQRVGETPLGHLTAWRVHRAKLLLHETPMSVGQVASRVGYESAAALNRVFVRHVGVTPGAWRRRITEAPQPQVAG